MITIGRALGSDIRVDERWDTVSNSHAGIDKRGDVLVYYDHSTNGTIINGQKIHNNNVEIYPGDKIMLAGVFELEWSVIGRFFPNIHRPTVIRNIRGEQAGSDGGRRTVHMNAQEQSSSASTGRMTEQWSNHPSSLKDAGQPAQTTGNEGKKRSTSADFGNEKRHTQAEIDKDVERWSWGGFLCTWLFAAYHKTYWPLAVLIAFLVPYIGVVCSIALCVYMGMNGRKMAWLSERYAGDFDAFMAAQRKWCIGGLLWFAASVVLTMKYTEFVLSYID